MKIKKFNEIYGQYMTFSDNSGKTNIIISGEGEVNEIVSREITRILKSIKGDIKLTINNENIFIDR